MFCSRTFLSDHNSLFNDGNYFFHTNLMKNDFSAKYFKDPFPQGGMGRGTPGYFGIERKRAKIGPTRNQRARGRNEAKKQRERERENPK